MWRFFVTGFDFSLKSKNFLVSCPVEFIDDRLAVAASLPYRSIDPKQFDRYRVIRNFQIPKRTKIVEVLNQFSTRPTEPKGA